MATADVGVLGEPLRLRIERGRRYDLWVFNVGLACCAVEFAAATLGPGAPRAVPDPGAEPLDLLVISGTVTDAMAPGIRRLYDELPRRPYVISFGACANCGGPYWDSYVVTKGIDQLLPVDVYVPGCPPRPEALLHGIARLEERLAAGTPPVPPRDAASLAAGPVRP